MKFLLLFSGLIIFASCSEQQNTINVSEASNVRTIYLRKCNACHGEEGNKGLGGAKDLTTSTLTDEEINEIIANGRGSMAGYKSVLSQAEITAVIGYVKSLRK